MVFVILLLIIKTDLVVDALKQIAIDKYKYLLNRLKKGYKDDYQDLLNLICFINIPIKIDKHEFIKQQFLNKNYGIDSVHFS